MSCPSTTTANGGLRREGVGISKVLAQYRLESRAPARPSDWWSR